MSWSVEKSLVTCSPFSVLTCAPPPARALIPGTPDTTGGTTTPWVWYGHYFVVLLDPCLPLGECFLFWKPPIPIAAVQLFRHSKSFWGQFPCHSFRFPLLIAAPYICSNLGPQTFHCQSDGAFVWNLNKSDNSRRARLCVLRGVSTQLQVLPQPGPCQGRE